MAPSSRSRSSQWQTRPDIGAFRVTKSSKLNAQPQRSKQKIDAIKSFITEKEQPQPQSLKQTPSSKKRRRDAVDSEAENEEVATRPQKSWRKARPTALPTPPASSQEPDVLAEPLEELISLHKSFVHALGVHYAHNGTRSAVSLSVLMPAMTRLWKRRNVCQQDIERMLGVWELPAESNQDIEHEKGPFKLVIAGIGTNQRTKLEYVWQNTSGTFIGNGLHKQYEDVIERLSAKTQKDSNSCAFFFDSLTNFPRLKCEIGTQTQARQEKISTIRDTILSKPNQGQAQTEPDFSKLNISDPSDPKTITREDKLKSRTLSLFDRLRAKQANATSGSPVTSADLLRRRALHRVPEIINTLRHKQSQKLNALFRSDLHGMPTATRTAKMRVSFSLEQLVQEIRDSGRVPIAPDEITECISILGQEIPDTWCSVYFREGLKCVTLQGEGWRKDEIREWCEKEIERMSG